MTAKSCGCTACGFANLKEWTKIIIFLKTEKELPSISSNANMIQDIYSQLFDLIF